jgi:hypothetical protein
MGDDLVEARYPLLYRASQFSSLAFFHPSEAPMFRCYCGSTLGERTNGLKLYWNFELVV